MSSTVSSPGSSIPDRVPPGTPYRGKEYHAAVGPPEARREMDPLVHPFPLRPSLFYRAVAALLRLLVPLLFRFRVTGLENLPEPPYILASNHQAWYDTLFIVAAIPKLPMVYTMARRDTVFNNRVMRWLLPKFGVFPILPQQGELDELGIATVYQVLSRGGVVLIFPEGRYSRGRELRPLKRGVAHFALQAGVPISPVALSGLARLRPFGEVELAVGPAIRPDPPRWWSLNRRVMRVVDSVRRAILRGFGRHEPPAAEGRLLARLRKRLRRLQLGHRDDRE